MLPKRDPPGVNSIIAMNAANYINKNLIFLDSKFAASRYKVFLEVATLNGPILWEMFPLLFYTERSFQIYTGGRRQVVIGVLTF